MFEPTNLLYALIIYVGIIFAKQKKSVAVSLVMAFIVINLLNMELISAVYDTRFLSIVIYEVLNVCVSFIVLTLTYNFAEMVKVGAGLTIVELLVSVGLVFLYSHTAFFIMY